MIFQSVVGIEKTDEGPAHVGKSPRLDRRRCFSVPKGVDLGAQRHRAVPAVPCFGESRDMILTQPATEM